MQQEEYKGADKQPYIKIEEVEVKLEECYDTQQEYENINNQYYITSEDIKIKIDEGDQDK